ncbi:MAG: ABC transporter ATP-binding protein [Clostridiales bacterium]|nr:ABC transporter ATP-binding protein [Clostridiales bacterium]
MSKDNNLDAIVVKNVTKTFNVFYDRTNTIKEKLLFWNRTRKEVRTVLKDINVTIKKGEVVGLIGVNGSGKSTLLKLMTKIIYPNKGSVETYGKLTSLLELGAGFHPDFSGRENIYFNASIFGLTRAEIDKRIDEIINFSELQEFIDNPVRTYSSGMYMRLAFSVAINVDAEILLIDEILSVGDQHFQEKCLKKMEELKAQGKTIVFVSHGLETVERFCTRAVWLHEGIIREDGDTTSVIQKYLKETA